MDLPGQLSLQGTGRRVVFGTLTSYAEGSPSFMSEKYSRRDFLFGVLITGALSAAATYLAPGGRRPRPVTLNLITGADPTGARALLIDMWNRINPDTTVTINVVSGETVDQRNEMISAAKNGAADILNLDTIDIPYFSRLDLITPVELEDVEVFLPSALRAGRVDNDVSRYWAAPFNADVGMLFERLAPSQALSSPAPTLPEIIDKRVADNSGQFIGQLQPSSSASEEAFVVNVLEHALNRDSQDAGDSGGLIDADGNPAYDLERWRKALEPLRVAIERRRITRSDTEDHTRETFQDSKLRYMRNWPVHYRKLQQEGDPAMKSARIRVYPLPVGILGGQSLALVKKSPHAARAVDLIRFLTDEPAQKIVAAHGLAPTRYAAYTDQNLQAFIPHLPAIRQAIEFGRPRPIHHNYRNFSRAVARHVNSMLRSNRPLPPQFIDEMRAALE